MSRIDAITAKLSAALGVNVEVTVRGARAFTFSTDTVTVDLGDKVSAFLCGLGSVHVDHDEECGSFAYVSVDGLGA